MVSSPTEKTHGRGQLSPGQPSNTPHVPPSVKLPSGRVIHVSSDVWDSGTLPTAAGSEEATAPLPVLMEKISAVIDAFKPLLAIDGTNGAGGVNQFIGALSNFGTHLQTVLACFATDLQVVSQGLSVAAATFAETDSQLTATLQGLDTQLAQYSVSQSPVTLLPATPAQTAGLTAPPLSEIDARNILPVVSTPLIFSASDIAKSVAPPPPVVIVPPPL